MSCRQFRRAGRAGGLLPPVLPRWHPRSASEVTPGMGLARGDFGQDEHVGLVKGLGKLIEEEFRPGIALGLEKKPPPGPCPATWLFAG